MLLDGDEESVFLSPGLIFLTYLSIDGITPEGHHHHLNF